MTDETLSALMAYPWPGNVRELEHALERAVILSRSNELDLSLFPTLPRLTQQARMARKPASPGATMEDIEREAILRTLESVGGSTSRAAAVLKISPRTIQYKLKEYRSRSVTEAPDVAREETS